MRTFYIKEGDGQVIFTPPMCFVEEYFDGFIYSSGEAGHNNLWVNDEDTLCCYVDKGGFMSDEMDVIQVMTCDVSLQNL